MRNHSQPLVYPVGLNYAEDKFANVQVAINHPVVGHLRPVVCNYHRREGSLSAHRVSFDYMIDCSTKIWALVQNEPLFYDAFVVSKLRMYCGYIYKTSNKDISGLDWVKTLYRELTTKILKSNATPHQRFVIRCFRRRWSWPFGKIAITFGRLSTRISKCVRAWVG